MKIAVLSDTHGFLPAKCIEVIAGSDAVVHAGDFDTADVYREIEAVCGTDIPFYAARGNCDWDSDLSFLQKVQLFEFENVKFAVSHKEVDLMRLLGKFDVGIFGHSHIYECRREAGILFLNPGSASRPRDGNKGSMVLLTLENNNISAERIFCR